MRIFQGISLAVWLGVGVAGAGYADPMEPARGSDLRQELLDTVRPLAAYDLGAPIEFRVLNMMVDENIAFVQVMAQRPGGAEIDMANTPMVEWRDAEPYDFDGPRFEFFLVQRDGYWQVTTYGLGSTDVWWAGHRCETFGSLLRELGC